MMKSEVPDEINHHHHQESNYLGKYCKECECISGYEPCSSCLTWKLQCHGVCICCRAFNRALGEMTFEDSPKPSRTERQSQPIDAPAPSGSQSMGDVSFLGPSLVPSTSGQSSSSSGSSSRATSGSFEFRTNGFLRPEKYCKECECLRGFEPCFSCLNWDFKCPGVCTCCKPPSSTDPRKDNFQAAGSRRTGMNSGSYNTLANGVENLNSTESKEPDIQPNDNKKGSCNTSGTDIQNLGLTETGELGIHSDDKKGFCNTIATGVQNLDLTANEEPDANDKGESTQQQEDSCVTAQILDVPKTNKGAASCKRFSRCEFCNCVKYHVSCKECIFWDFNCTFTKKELCTCCDTFEKMLPEVD